MTPATILTLANGKGIDLLSPKASDIIWGVVAEQLAKEARYNGATPNTFYSVAQHVSIGSIAISEAMAAGYYSAEETIELALLPAYFQLHDNPEHVLRDDTTPKKRAICEIARQKFGILADQILECFDDLTERHDAANHEAAGLPWPMTPKMKAAVKHWDLRMFVTEWRDLMLGIPHPNWDDYKDFLPLTEKIVPLSWQDARNLYFARARAVLPCFASKRQALRLVTDDAGNNRSAPTEFKTGAP